MKPYCERKFTIIGLGFLMEYIFKNFETVLGDKLKYCVNGVTADKNDLEGKKGRLGIEVLLEDNAKALRDMCPDMIFFAPPPSIAKELTENCLAPYFKQLRGLGEPLPQLIAFPPSPDGDYYVEQLGADLQVVNIIPNMISEVGSENVSNEAHNLITYPLHDNWPEEEKEALEEFFLPMGRSLRVPPDLILPVLSAEIGTHPLTELADIAAKAFTERGIICTYHDTASVMRALHQQRRDYRSPNSNNCDAGDVEHAGAREQLKSAVDTWFDALNAFLTAQGFSTERSVSLLDPLFDLYFHEAQLEDRRTIVGKAKKDATKGGMLELCMASYYKLLEPLWERYFAAPGVSLDTDALDEAGRIINEIAHAVVERGKGLTESAGSSFTPYQHAVMFAELAKSILEEFGPDEGDKLIYRAVEKYGTQRGERMAQRCVSLGKPLDMASYQAFTEWRYNNDFKKEKLFDEPYSAYKVLQCPWFAAWKRAEMSEYGRYYCRNVDKSILKGFNPELTLEMPSYHSAGGSDYCEFHWKDLLPGDEHNDRKSAIEAEIGDSCLKDFVYHTAHIYSTMVACSCEENEEKGREVALNVRKRFSEKCSYQEWLKVLSLAGEDFDRA